MEITTKINCKINEMNNKSIYRNWLLLDDGKDWCHFYSRFV